MNLVALRLGPKNREDLRQLGVTFSERRASGAGAPGASSAGFSPSLSRLLLLLDNGVNSVYVRQLLHENVLCPFRSAGRAVRDLLAFNSRK